MPVEVLGPVTAAPYAAAVSKPVLELVTLWVGGSSGPLQPAAIAGVVSATASPSTIEAFVRSPAPTRMGASQCGQAVSVARAWHPQDGQAIIVGRNIALRDCERRGRVKLISVRLC